MYASAQWNPGNISRPTKKGYRKPKGNGTAVHIPVVFKPKKITKTDRQAVRIIKGHAE